MAINALPGCAGKYLLPVTGCTLQLVMCTHKRKHLLMIEICHRVPAVMTGQATIAEELYMIGGKEWLTARMALDTIYRSNYESAVQMAILTGDGGVVKVLLVTI